MGEASAGWSPSVLPSHHWNTSICTQSLVSSQAFIFVNIFIMCVNPTHQLVMNFITIISLRVGDSLGWTIYKDQNSTSYMVVVVVVDFRLLRFMRLQHYYVIFWQSVIIQRLCTHRDPYLLLSILLLLLLYFSCLFSSTSSE